MESRIKKLSSVLIRPVWQGWIKTELFLCMSHILFKSNFLFSGCTVKFHMASDELLDDRYCFPGQKCAEDSADSDSVESMEDCKGEDYGGCQTAEIKGCLDDFVIFLYNP